MIAAASRLGPRPAPGAATAEHAVVWVIGLSRGSVTSAGASAVGDWDAVLSLATRERCAALAWRRSAAVIRDVAPAAVTARWRALAVRTELDSRLHCEQLVHVVRTLEAARVETVVVKGPPLAERLYGDPFVRPLNDLDLYVAAGDRAEATRALLADGWALVESQAPFEESFRKLCGAREVFLEIHSSVGDDPLLSHLALPAPQWTPVRLLDTALRAHDGPLLAPFLAAHLAKHTLPPLLWLIDFATLWSSLSAAERSEAESAADRLNLDGYLRWAVRRSALLDAADAGDETAVMALGFAEGARPQLHNMLRVATLASSPLDAMRVVAAWAWPPAIRDDPRAFLALVRQRVRTPWTRIAVKRQETTVADRGPVIEQLSPEARPLRVDRRELVDVSRDTLTHGNPLWLRIHGTSMLPAIPRGSLVRIAPLPPRPLRVGDVVLVTRASGAPMMHRVIELVDGVRTKGDNCHDEDGVTPLDRVLGVADVVTAGGVTRPIPAAPRRALRRIVSRLRQLTR